MMMFIQFAKGILDDQALEAKAAQLGLMIGTAGTVVKSNWDSDYAIAGNTFPVKDILKANGARWNGAAKAWTFASMEDIKRAIEAL